MTAMKTKKTIDPIRQHIRHLRLIELTFHCEAQSAISFGPDMLKGNRLRGGLGHALRAVSCAMRPNAPCAPCTMKDKCFYYLGFEIDKPHPYLIRPVYDGKQSYKNGDAFSFSLVLIGDGIPYAYRFIKAFELLGSQGIGRGRGQFLVRDVWPSAAHEASEFFTGARATRKRHTIRLLSPLRLEHEEQGLFSIDGPFPFLFFLRNLVNRIVNLNNLFGENADYERTAVNTAIEELLRQAEDIRCEENLSWFEGERHSARSRSQKPQKIEGFLGELRLHGDLKPFLPYLRIGEIIGAGSNTTIGFGRFEIRKQ